MERIRSRSLQAPGMEISRKVVTKPAKLHLHEYYELEILLSGTGEQDLNGTVYPLSPGCAYFLTPIDFHAITPHTPMEIANLSFDESLLSPQMRLLFMNRRQNMIFREDTAIRTLFELLLQESGREDAYSAQCKSGLLELILLHIARAQGTEAVAAPGNVQQSMQYLFCHFRDDITLEEVARQSGYTPNYFSRLFHSFTGMRFVDFLNMLRLNYAKMLLMSTELSVTEVAERSGFGSASNFFRRFGQQCGQSPTAFRKS